MTKSNLTSRLEFLRSAERLKDTLRSGHTTQGRTESVADHTWRLSLVIITFADLLGDIDLLRLLKICIVHDLGEAIDGDIPAPMQDPAAAKSHKERTDFRSLIAPLPESVRAEFLALWDEYDAATSDEARVAKAFDKIETILQHNQGQNPQDFDYLFNLEYGKSHTDAVPLAARVRELIDNDTRSNARKAL